MVSGTDCELVLAEGSSLTANESSSSSRDSTALKVLQAESSLAVGLLPRSWRASDAGVVASSPSSYECNHSNKQRRANNGPDYWEVRSADLDGKEFR